MNKPNSYLTPTYALAGALICGWAAGLQGATTVTLYEWGINSEATIINDPLVLPPYINDSAFNFGTGLGTITATISSDSLGAGTHYFGLYVDHEIDEAVNTFFNEFGKPENSPQAKQTWEIDEPGFVHGDIYNNFLARQLDNANQADALGDDVSMAMAWEFNLNTDEKAVIKMQLGESMPASGFYLEQYDPDSAASVYFSSTIQIEGVNTPDGGSTMGLLGLTLASLQILRRKN